MLSDEDFLAFSSYICFLSFFMSTACKHSNFKRFQVNAHRLWKCRADQVSWRSISRRCWSDRVHRWVQGVTVKVATRSDKSWTKMTFLDLTVEVRSILIRHYWQVTPVFLPCKAVVSLQLHMRRGKVLGTRAKKEGWEGEKRKINAPTLLNPLDLASYSGSAPCLKVPVSHCYASYCPLFLFAIHALSSFPSFAESLLS